MKTALRVRTLVTCLAMVVTAWWSETPLDAGDDTPKPVTAPPRHAIVGDTLNGWYFAPLELKQSYDQTLKDFEALQGQIDAGEIDAAAAKRQFTELRQQLGELRRKIEDSRVLVQGAAINEQTETREFDLGPERRLAITANQVRVVGWNGAKVKAELKKTVLSPAEQPVSEDLKAIAIVHRHERAEFAGKTDAEWEAAEAEFLANQGAKLTAEQRAGRQAFVQQIRSGFRVHRELQAKMIDQLSIQGLDYESNRVINWRVSSENGEGRWGSVRQRYAELTVYVPACTSVTVRGAARGLVVENLAADLTVVNEGSTDSDSRARFEINGLRGNLVCRNFPLHRVSNVTGDVQIEATLDDSTDGGGTSHHNDLRTMTSGRPFPVEIDTIAGAVRVHYGRVTLDLRNIGGVLDVANDFGDTRLVLDKPLPQAAHRIFSQSGRIDVELSAQAWGSLPVSAATNHGTARTNISREEFDDFHLQGEDRFDGVRRQWSGFVTKASQPDPLHVFQLIERFSQVAAGGNRSVGLDLLTRSGRVSVLRK